MEAFSSYLLKSVIWLMGFTLVFFMFLRNERFFLLNRIFLIAGILTSFIFPFISVRYTIVVPVINDIPVNNVNTDIINNVGISYRPDFGLILLGLYLSGLCFVISVIIKHIRKVLKVIRKASIISSYSVKIVRDENYTSSFSFFSYVFINPSITDFEIREIINHELAHIRQRHWFDLMLVELICMLQWFNPLVWIYSRFVKQNHEYLADETALKITSDPAKYKAVLLNQIVGSPVVNLANFFNYSINKKRFYMMKRIISSPYRRLKLLLILPVFAVVLFAFAKPEYRFTYYGKSTDYNYVQAIGLLKAVKGTILQEDGKPLEGAIIIVKGEVVPGVSSDAKGYFMIGNVPDTALLAVSAPGFIPAVIKPEFTRGMTIKLKRDIQNNESDYQDIPPPPPPPKYTSKPPPPPPPPASSSTPSPPNAASLLPPPPPPASSSTKPLPPDAASLLPPPPPPSLPPPPPSDMQEGIKFRFNDGNKFNDGKKPLFVVDGKVTDIDLNTIDPSSIQSITVIKDIRATDKYGEKAKYGVIEITTKNNSSGNTKKK